jgi:hypothetical protein
MHNGRFLYNTSGFTKEMRWGPRKFEGEEEIEA